MITTSLALPRGTHTIDDVTLEVGHAGNVRWRSDCAQCVKQGKNAFAPQHDAMPDCQSGARAHCTCDGCF